jgi:periplasmic protein TonB
VAIAPTPPPAVAAASAPPAVITAGVACSNYSTVMGDVAFPREAVRAGLERGDAVVQFTLTASGETKDIHAIRASNPIFGKASVRIVEQYKCKGRDVTVQVPFGYKVE